MRHLVFFVIISALWAIADHYIAPPVAHLIAWTRGGTPGQTEEPGHADQHAQTVARFEAVNLGIAEGLVGLAFGAFTGLLRGHPVLAVSFTTSAWSWIATLCLILASLIGAAVHQILLLLINQLA